MTSQTRPRGRVLLSDIGGTNARFAVLDGGQVGMIAHLAVKDHATFHAALDAYLGSLPGHGVENVRRPLINTMNLADLLPTSTIWTGLNQAPCPLYPPQYIPIDK